MIISIDEEKKKTKKIQYPFIIEDLKDLQREELYLNMIKAIYNKPVARKILNTQSNPEQREQ
jgi:hypothetical protein